MAEKDLSQKQLQEEPEVFADIFNAVIFKGKEVLRPERLRHMERETVSQPGSGILKQMFRDVCMMDMDSGTEYLILGIENQTEIDVTMPLRGMGFDYAAYEKEVKRLARENLRKRGKKGTGKLHRGQKITPVVTLILYYGEEEWKGARSLHDMLKLPDENLYPGILPYIHDYGMNLVSIKNLSQGEASRFTSDFRLLVQYIRHRKDKNELDRLFADDTFSIEHPYETLSALAAITGDSRYLDIGRNVKEKRGLTMCVILDEAEKRGEIRGEKRGEIRGEIKGEKKGQARVNRLVELLARQNRIDDIIKAAQIPEYQERLFREFGL